VKIMLGSRLKRGIEFVVIVVGGGWKSGLSDRDLHSRVGGSVSSL